MQQSPELGDVLPAVAVLLEEELGVDGFALTARGGDGIEHIVFAAGRPVDEGARPDPDRTSLEAGETLVVGLRRADRDVGALRVRASRRLGSLDVESVRVAAELLAAALISAQAFERQESAMAALRQVDELVSHAVHPQWTTKENSMKAVKRELNALFKKYALPRTGEPMESAWRYILQHY